MTYMTRLAAHSRKCLHMYQVQLRHKVPPSTSALLLIGMNTCLQ